jgi:hypothetical protein
MSDIFRAGVDGANVRNSAAIRNFARRRQAFDMTLDARGLLPKA